MAGAELLGGAKGPGRARWKRALLAWLIIVGIPAGLEFGSVVSVDVRPHSAFSSIRTRIASTQRASLGVFPSGTLGTHIEFGAVLPITFADPEVWMGSAPIPLPRGKFRIDFELIDELGTDGPDRRWRASDELDLDKVSTTSPWVVPRVSMSRIAGRELPEGTYRLYVDVHELAGPRAGMVSRGMSKIELRHAPQPPLPTPPNYMGAVVRMEFDHFEPGASGTTLVLRAHNLRDGDIYLRARPATGAPAPPGPVDATEGGRYRTSFASCSLWRAEHQREAAWREMGAADSTLGEVRIPPGLSVEIEGAWVEHGFGYRAAQVFMRGGNTQSWVSSDPFLVELDDSTTSGPPILWIAMAAGSVPKLRGRRVENWESAPAR